MKKSAAVHDMKDMIPFRIRRRENSAQTDPVRKRYERKEVECKSVNTEPCGRAGVAEVGVGLAREIFKRVDTASEPVALTREAWTAIDASLTKHAREKKRRERAERAGAFVAREFPRRLETVHETVVYASHVGTIDKAVPKTVYASHVGTMDGASDARTTGNYLSKAWIMQSNEVTEKYAGTRRQEREQTPEIQGKTKSTDDAQQQRAAGDRDLDAEQVGSEALETRNEEQTGVYYTRIWNFVRNYLMFPLLKRLAREEGGVVGEGGGGEGISALASSSKTEAVTLRGEVLKEGRKDVLRDPPKDPPRAPPKDPPRDLPRRTPDFAPWDSGLFGFKVGVSKDPYNFRLEAVDVRGRYKQKTEAIQTEDSNEELIDASVGTDDRPEEPAATDTDMKEDDFAPASGMFSDGSRRTDLVLVLRKEVGEAGATREVLLNFLTGLVKLGIHIEVDEGVLPQHGDLQFVKLHAPDTFLNTYAEVFGVKKYFRESHEQFINKRRNLFTYFFGHRHERELIKMVRRQYEGPLRLSSLDRSYLVYQLLQHQIFGRPSNYYGLQRLLDNNIVVDAFALHDGPLRPSPGQPVFTCRQILYLHWLGPFQIFKTQPLHLIYEYFGSKLALYFALYELVNKMLLVSSLWAVGCSLLYMIKDKEYMRHTREYYCNEASMRENAYMVKMGIKWREETCERSVVCAECEGVNDTDVCPFTLMMDYCFDLHMMRIFDNPYVILYSFGIAFLALLLAFEWQRAESFWRWMWEETGTLRLARPRYEPRGDGWIALLQDVSVNILRTIVFEVLLPICVVASIVSTMFVAFIYNYDRWRRMSTTNFTAYTTTNGTKAWNVSPPIVDRKKEYAVLMAVAACVHVLFYAAEQLCHWISYWSTRAENHRSHEEFDESLCNKYFTFSFVYSSSLVIYFAWIKGAFYYSPLSSWDLIVNLTTPWRHYSVNLSAALPPRWFHLLRLAVTMNCGPYSCVRQGFAVFLVTLAFRVVLVSLVPFLWRWGRTCCFAVRDKRRKEPRVEREYQLRRVGSRQLAKDLNTLVLHFSLVLLFAPLFPLAPLVLLLVNVCDLKSKARMYLMSRRAVLQRAGAARGARGGREGVLPTAGDILRAVCYAVPLCHGLCIARMEVLKKYVYHKWARRRSLDSDLFTEFLHAVNYHFTNVSRTNQQFYNLNLHRIVDRGNDSQAIVYVIDPPAVGVDYQLRFYGLQHCRVNGFLQHTVGRTSAVWPAQAPAMHENVTNSAPMPEHYEWLFYKALFVLLYTVAFAVVAACLWQRGAGWSRGVCARAAREATLRRLRLGERGPMSRLAARPARGAPPHSPRT